MTIRQIPLTFVVVLVIAICLTIFFGAWAVSTDVDGAYSGLFASKSQRGPLGGSATPLDPSVVAEEESWLASGLLFACPLH